MRTPYFNLLIGIGLFVVVTETKAQDGTTSIVYTPDSVKHINRKAIYPGKQDGFMKDIADNFKIPEKAIKDNLHGQLFLEITVDTTGKIVNPIVKKGLRKDIDKAAIEMTKRLKRFTPATMDERKVPTTITIPIYL